MVLLTDIQLMSRYDDASCYQEDDDGRGIYTIGKVFSASDIGQTVACKVQCRSKSPEPRQWIFSAMASPSSHVDTAVQGSICDALNSRGFLLRRDGLPSGINSDLIGY